MKTLEDHDAERMENYRQKQVELQNRNLNGIECPKCKAELVDTSLTVSFGYNPPRMAIHCSKCEYTGTRIA